MSAFTHFSKLNSFVGSFYGSDDGACAFQSFFVFFLHDSFQFFNSILSFIVMMFLETCLIFLLYPLVCLLKHYPLLQALCQCYSEGNTVYSMYTIQIFSSCIYVFIYSIFHVEASNVFGLTPLMLKCLSFAQQKNTSIISSLNINFLKWNRFWNNTKAAMGH